MDSKFYVSLKAAKLLKELGYSDYSTVYDCSVEGSIFLNQQPIYGDWAGDRDVYPCPTKSEAIHWIECNYYLRISIIYVDEGLYEYEIDDLNSGASTSGFASSRLDAENDVIIRSIELISSPIDNGV